jgi:hypothetical protein
VGQPPHTNISDLWVFRWRILHAEHRTHENNGITVKSRTTRRCKFCTRAGPKGHRCSETHRQRCQYAR